MNYNGKIRSALFASTILVSGVPALAQEAGADNASRGFDEIVVSARKRDETSIAVPVALTAVSGSELERRAISNLDGLTRMVPQLQLGAGGGTIQGGHVGIRGISSSDSNPFADQAVSFNIDGVQVSRSNIRRMSEMDTAQVEVLKGPQALFFGKNSPGGIISIRSADPTDQFEAKASVGYEFNAREIRGEGYISGPLTDNLGIRIAGYGTTMRGWFKNDFATDANNMEFAPANTHTPKAKEWAVRGTLKWEPTDRFNARLKVTYNNIRDVGVLTSQEYFACPQGALQLGAGPDNCRLDGEGQRLDVGPYLGQYSERFRDGEPFLRMKQALVSYEMNYDIDDNVSLTSVTGYYYLHQRSMDNYNMAWDPDFLLPNAGTFGNKEFSQELRLASSFDGWLNFLVGGYYQSAKAHVTSTTYFGARPNNGVGPLQLNNYALDQKGKAYSAFGQLIFTPIDVIEITAGGRYSYEKKSLPYVAAADVGNGFVPLTTIPENPNSPRSDDWSNFSPEATISYRPTGDLTIYASYKRGFLSGGFNSGSGSIAGFSGDLRFDQQKIKGWEGGVKAALFNGALRTNLAAYRYKITGMQVTTSTTGTTGVPTQVVLNAGETTIQGAEFDFTYRTPLEGLSLHGAVGYNDAEYDIFSVGCYAGQTPAMGCNMGPANPVTGAYALQDLAGYPVLRAPKWTMSGGAGYEADLGSTLRLGVNVDATYSSGYFSNVTAADASWQKKYALLDANIRIGDQDDKWDVALIGRNLTDKHYVVRSVDTPLTGANTGLATGVLADVQGAVNRGREIMLRLTYKY